jgi:KDO2-lipid IV(A) lauroyltransferase
MLYWVYQAGTFLAGFVPPPLAYWLVRRGGELAYYALPSRRRIAADNFAHVLGLPPDDAKVDRVVRDSFRNFGCYLYEVTRLPHLSVNDLQQRAELCYGDHFQSALARGKGVIYVSAHFGNMDLVGAALAKEIGPITIAGTPLKPKKLMDKLVESRAAKGVKISVYEGAPRDVLTALRRNETVGFLVDLGVQWTDRVMVDFFGAPAAFPRGLALLARKTGAAIVPGYTRVRPDHTVEAVGSPPIIVDPTDDKDSDVRACMQQIATAFESFIGRYPEQWYIYRPIWGEPFRVLAEDPPGC